MIQVSCIFTCCKYAVFHLTTAIPLYFSVRLRGASVIKLSGRHVLQPINCFPSHEDTNGAQYESAIKVPATFAARVYAGIP